MGLGEILPSLETRRAPSDLVGAAHTGLGGPVARNGIRTFCMFTPNLPNDPRVLENLAPEMAVVATFKDSLDLAY